MRFGAATKIVASTGIVLTCLLAVELLASGSPASAVPTTCGNGLGISIGATVLEGGGTGPAAPDDVARLGDAIDYSVTVSNNPVTISNNSVPACPVTGDTVTLTLPNGTVQTLATNQSFASGTSQTYDEQTPLYVTAQTDVGTNGSVSATAGSSGSATESNGFVEPVTASTQTEVPVIHPETTLVKTSSVMSGTVPFMVTYTFTESNVSSDPAGVLPLDSISAVSVVDSGTGSCTVPATPMSGDTNTNGLLDPGESWVFQCTTDLTVAGTYTDQASATGDAGDGRPAGTVASGGAPSTEESNEVSVAALTPASVVTVKTEPTPGDGVSVTAGQAAPITYNLAVTNSGQTAATDVAVTDPIPAGSTYVTASASCGTAPSCMASFASNTVSFAISSLAGDATDTLSFQVSVNATDANGSTITNQASFTDVNTPSCSAGPTAGTCLTGTVSNPVVAPIINVSKSEPTPGNGVSVTAGQAAPITYDLAVANTGGAAASNVTVNDPIPAGTMYVAASASCGTTPNCVPSFASGTVTFTLTSVASGASETLSFQVSVNATDANGSTITNQASFTDVNTPSCSAGPTAGTCLSNTVSNPVVGICGSLAAYFLTATSRTGNFTGLFCVNASGTGTYTQSGGATGLGKVLRSGSTTWISASGQNLALLGEKTSTFSTFTETAPAPMKTGTFTLTMVT